MHFRVLSTHHLLPATSKRSDHSFSVSWRPEKFRTTHCIRRRSVTNETGIKTLGRARDMQWRHMHASGSPASGTHLILP